MEAKTAEKRGLQPLGAFKGWAVAGCEPDEMGIGPVFAIPKLLKLHGLKIDDIDLWELNEAFASQCLYSRDKLGIDPDKYNVNGGSIAIGHPFGATGARIVTTLVNELAATGKETAVLGICAAGGLGAAAVLERV
jgi:acetyl-CoA C-acetyltransferase